ncbi:MAG: hypothetical protein R3D57_15885 [Hyphomicrobiaceae bacterium]
MDIGALIGRLSVEQNAEDAFTALGDIILYAEVLRVGAHFDESPAIYVAGAVARFADGAGDSEWTSAFAAMERAEQPGQAFLVQAIRWALARDAAVDHDEEFGGRGADDASSWPRHGNSS